MKKLQFLSLTCLLMFITFVSKAQLSGTKNIPGDYATLVSAITDLNTQGVGAGGVTLNLLAANPQTAPAGGYSITATGTAANPIIITGNNNTITASLSLTAGSLNDGIFKIIGGDYITIQNFTMFENSSNTTGTLATNNMTEFGVALFYASSTNGAQNNTIKNNTITLNNATVSNYANTIGIYSNVRHTATSMTGTADITSASGANSNNKVYGNTISNVNFGMVFVGSLTGDFMDNGLDVGGASGATGNTITNFGTTATFSGYVSVSTTSINGITANNQLGLNISYNNITSSVGGVTGTGTIRGVYCQVSGTLPISGSYVRTINNNSISVKGGNAANLIHGILHEGNSSIISYTINNNDFHDFDHTTGTASGAFVFISAGLNSAVQNATISGNTFTNMTVKTTGNVTFINKSVDHPASAVINILNNTIVTQFIKTGAGGTVTGYSSATNSPLPYSETNSGNNFSNITATGAAIVVWGSQGVNADKSIFNNTFTGISGGSSGVTVLRCSSPATQNNVYGNTINNVTSLGDIKGINVTAGSCQISNNTVSNLSGAVNVTGIDLSGFTIAFGNKIYDIQATGSAGLVNGILASNLPANTVCKFYNNLIGNLSAPSANGIAVNGINISISAVNTTFDVWNNSVYLNQSTASGTDFGSSAVNHTSSTTASLYTLLLTNNILVNTSVFTGTGTTAALRRSATTLNNYSLNSNNNLLYAGTPGGSNLIYAAGANTDQTLIDFKTRMGTRETNSITQAPVFLSTTGSSANFLHIDPSAATQIESGGTPIVDVTVDYDGNARNSNFPDIGADEFAGTANDVTGPTLSYALLYNSTSTSNRTVTVTIKDPSGIGSGGSAPLIYYRKGTSGAYTSAVATSIVSNDYTFTIDNTLIGGVAAGDIVQYYFAAVDIPGNLSTSPNGGAGSAPPGLTAPAIPNQYKISQEYVWQGVTNDFQLTTNWSPNRVTPDASDILIFDGIVTPNTTVNLIPAQTITKLVFRSGVNATLNAAVANNVLTADYGTAQTGLDISSTSIVTIGTATALNISFGSSQLSQVGIVAGTLILNAGSVLSVTNAITTISGTLTMNGSSSVQNANIETLLFGNVSILNFNEISGTVPTATYHSNSMINITGIVAGTSLSWPTAAVGNLNWNCTTQTSAFNTSSLTMAGSFTIQSTNAGSLGIASSNIAGNATISNGTWNIPNADVTIGGVLTQNNGSIIKTGTSTANWTVGSANQTAGTLSMAAVNGIFSLKASSGNLTFAGTVNGGTGATGGLAMTFTGTGNQTLNTTGATVTNKAGITVNKSTGSCTLLSDFTANSGASITLTSGKLTIAASKTLTIASGATVTGTSSSNYFVSEASGANLGKLKYSGLTTVAQSFAVGTATNYMPVTVTPTTTGSSFAVGVFEGATVNGTPNGASLASPVLNNIVKATYQIDNSVVATPASVSLAWNTGQEGSGFTGVGNSAIGIAKYNGATYDEITGTGDNTANIASASFSSFSPFVVGTKVGKASLKLFLQGAYNTATGIHKDVTATWAAVLNVNALSQPYSGAPFNYTGTESVSNGFFTSTGATTDITDWVLLELRDQTTPATVIARRAAFVREDGVVVDLDGTSNVVFPGVANGNYFMTIRHRNHLSIRTSATIAIDGSISSTGTLYNLTTAQSQAFQDGAITTNAAMGSDGGVFIMWAGNGNSDLAVRASGPPADNDYLYLVNDILGGNTATILSNVYHAADMNLDGAVRASGPPDQNDYLFLVNAILGGNTATIYTAHQ